MMTRRAVGRIIAGFLRPAAPAMAAELPAELISGFRLKLGEVRVVRDATLDRIALEQARAMAAKNDLSHGGARPLRRADRVGACGASRRILPMATRFREDARSVDRFSGHRKNLLLHNASRVGVANAKDASGKRTYWAMVIAGDYEPKPKGKRDREPLVAVKREVSL